MRLNALKRNWERLGSRDPFWAALTHHDKRDRRWDAAAFFESGVDEIAAVLARAEQRGLPVARRRALDFGCGAGRLTQAMARHFERCDGVDISSSMLTAAAGYNRFPDRCTYHLNTRTDLALFADGAFDFAYSTLVLQHMEPRYSRGYIAELLRVLAPGGLLVFQLPSHLGPIEPSPGEVRTPASQLPPSACRARIVTNEQSVSAGAGELLTLPATVENRSPYVWPALPAANGGYQIKLANRWLLADGALVRRDDGRAPLPCDLAPGARADLLIGVHAPAWNGTYWIELDLVQEDVTWFAERGSPTTRVACRVTGGLPASELPASEAPPPARPFRERHPQLFQALRVTGLRDLYWRWRRGLDAVRSGRDRLVVGIRQMRLVPRTINWWRRGPFAPRMEMYCVPRHEVVAVIDRHGGQLVDLEVEPMPGGFQSYRYWIRKP